MKKQIAILTAAFALAASVQGQTWSNLVSLTAAADQAKSLTFVASPAYAPDIVVNGKKAPWGAALGLFYPVLDVGPVRGLAGARVDWLADSFWAPSVDLQLQTSVKLFGKVDVTPFAVTGAIFPLGNSGRGRDAVGAIAGGGAGVRLWSWDNGKTRGHISAGYAVEKWTNFDGLVHRIGGAVTVGF